MDRSALVCFCVTSVCGFPVLCVVVVMCCCGCGVCCCVGGCDVLRLFMFAGVSVGLV